MLDAHRLVLERREEYQLIFEVRTIFIIFSPRLIASRQVLMRYKIFGERTGLKVSELALGTGMYGQTWGYGATPEEAKRIIEGFADAGGNFAGGARSRRFLRDDAAVGAEVRTHLRATSAALSAKTQRAPASR